MADWRAHAACHGIGGLFFQVDPDSPLATEHRISKAKQVCRECPVRAQCAAYALTVAEPYGIWGGFTERERMLLLDSDWKQWANRRCTWVDVTELQARLHALRSVHSGG
jgi:WhiB family transcriptional regulator, redox-sensing transcriptional regulator